MSGGYFNYRNDSACNEIFGYNIYPNYGDKGFSQSKKARQINPLEDKMISELVFDCFCLLHSFDWYKCGDTDEEDYKEDVNRFKRKWFKKPMKDIIKRMIDDDIDELRKQMYEQYFDWQGDEDSNE